MASQLQLRRGTTVQHVPFIGAPAEVTVDTDKKTVVVHDGTTQGGFPLSRESVIATGSVTRRSISDRFADVINVKDFGAVGDGVADDTAAIQSAVTAFRHVLIPSGTYNVTGIIYVPSNTVVEMAGGATINIGTAPSGTAAFLAAGTFGSAYNLTANTTAFGTSLALSSGDATNFAAGDWIQILSDTVYDANWTDSKYGELVRIFSVSGGTITLREPLVGGPYTTADSARIRKANFVSNVTVTGGRIVGSTNAATLHTGVRMQIANNCRVSNVKVERCNAWGVNYRNSVFCSVDNVYVEGDPNTAVNSYAGVNLTDACQDIKVSNSVFVSVHHAFTTTSSDGWGQIRRALVDGCTAISSNDTGDQFDTHANSEDIWFTNCTAINSSANGFNLECGSGGVVNCKAIKPALNGINMTCGATVKQSNFQVIGSQVDSAGIYGIRANQGSQINSATTERISIVDSSAVGCQIGAYLSGSASLLVANAEVVGGYYTATSASGAIFAGDYVQGFRIQGAHAQTGLVAGSVIQLNGSNVSHGVVSDCVTQYTVSGATGVSNSASIRITDASNITVSSNVGIMPSPSGGWGIRTTGSSSSIVIGSGNNFSAATNAGHGFNPTALTLSSGVITLSNAGNGIFRIDHNGSPAAQDLNTINGGIVGQQITLVQAASARDFVVKDTVGNLRLAGDFAMDNLQDSITLYYDGAVWVEIARADIG